MNRLKKLMVRMDLNNPQIFFQQWKDKTLTMARKRDKVLAPVMAKKISKLKGDIKHTLNDPKTNEAYKLTQAGILKERITTLEAKCHSKKRMTTKVMDRLEGEMVSKWWSKVNATKNPREIR